MQQTPLLSPVSSLDLAQLLRRRTNPASSVLVEALPRSYFDSGHIPGAVHLPHDVSDSEVLRTLPNRSLETIVYCASATCPNSHLLAARLVNLGYSRVLVFSEGKAAWVQAGHALER